MSDLQDASRRLEAALTRLDRAVSDRLQAAAAPAAGPVDAEAEAAAAAARADSARLLTVADEVARRLDETIARIDRVLET